jgi:ABC-type antimicrobial peptide transport system permease subunit
MVEGLVEGLYMPDRGFSGLPMYLTAEPDRYLRSVYHEPELGQGDSFSALMHRLGEGKVLSSTSVGTFYKKGLDQPMPVGRTTAGRLERVPFGGAVHFLPGVPLRTVNEREGFISARVDYLNHLFTNSPYLIGDARNQSFADLDVLIPRVILTITASGNGSAGDFQDRVLKTIEIKPLDVHDLDTEVARLGGDMYIYLARQNVQIYLLGGLILALIGIFSVAYANYVEDRRTLALLRIRGAGPLQVVRFFMPNIIGPSVVGFIIGALMALAGGFGITKLVWELRQLQTVLNYLPTHLALSQQTAVIGGILLLAVIGIAVAFGRWVFARTARQSLLEG